MLVKADVSLGKGNVYRKGDGSNVIALHTGTMGYMRFGGAKDGSTSCGKGSGFSFNCYSLWCIYDDDNTIRIAKVGVTCQGPVFLCFTLYLTRSPPFLSPLFRQGNR